MRILNFGSCNIDHVYSLDHIVEKGETQSAMSFSLFAGGKGLNQSIALAKAGADVFHAGCIGEDGGMLLDALTESGVSVEYIKRVDAKNGHAVIQVSKDAENSIFIYSGSNSMISEELVDDILSHFSRDDILVLQNEINGIEYIVNKAYEKGMKIALNPSPCSGAVLNIDLSMISYLILNEVEAQTYTGATDHNDSLAFFCEHYPELCVVLTLGSDGSVYQYKTKKVFQPIFMVDAVDTTAAGDTFTGYFIAETVRGCEPERAMKIAACASAICVSKRGASPAIPCIDEVMAGMPSMKERVETI